MIVATSGHVDHGKTCLLRALTGVDTDRLPEEKARGLSIDLGYAYWDRGDGKIVGFVDVPGHERFIANMLSGVGTMDAALLVVAADEGVMPQTREHLDILDLLGVPGGIIALTKTDRAEPSRIASIESELRSLLRDTPLAAAPVIPCSAVTGDGIDNLAKALRRVERATRPEGTRFRMAIDRVFSLPGVGLTVTGAVSSGAVGVGGKVMVSPGGPLARVRSIHSQGRPATRAEAGRRCALSLAGASVDQSNIWRGQWLAEPDGAIETDRIEVTLRSSRHLSRPLRKSFHARLHIGTANVPARVVALDDGRTSEGATPLAQVLPEQPIDTVWGDRFVLRDPASRETLAGGKVVTPFGIGRGRSKPDRLALLRAMSLSDSREAFDALLNRPPMTVEAKAFARARNLGDGSMRAAVRTVEHVEATGPVGPFCVHPRQWRLWQDAVVAALETAHRNWPERLGLSTDQLRKAMTCAPPNELMTPLVDSIVEEGRIAVRAGSAHLADHRPRLSPGDESVWSEIRKTLDRSTPHAPAVHELAKTDGHDVEDLRRLLVRAASLKLAVQVSKNRFALPETIRTWAESAEAVSRGQGDFTVVMFKAEAEIGRNLAIEVLEYFDQTGFTRRKESRRSLLKTAAQCFGSY